MNRSRTDVQLDSVLSMLILSGRILSDTDRFGKLQDPVHVLYLNTAVTKVFIPSKTKLQDLVSSSVNSRQYVVMCIAVARQFGPSAEMSRPRTEVSRPMVRTVSALGPKCLSAEMSWCQSVQTSVPPIPKCLQILQHWWWSVSGPNCLGSNANVSVS